MTVPLTLTGVVGDGAVAVYDTFSLPSSISAAQGATTSVQFILPSPYTSVATAYMQVDNNAPDPGTGSYTNAWDLTTTETDTVSHTWTAQGRSDIPDGTYSALVHAIFEDASGAYTAGDWDFTLTLGSGGVTAVTLPLDTATHENERIQVAANTLSATSTVTYLAPAGYDVSDAAVTVSEGSLADTWLTNCRLGAGCLADSDLHTTAAPAGSSLMITVPSLEVLTGGLATGNPYTAYLNIDVDNPTAALGHVTFEFKTTFTQPSGAGSGGGGSAGGGGSTSGTVTAGGSFSSDPPGAAPSSSNPLVVTVTSPVAGAIAITKGIEGESIGGYTPLGLSSQISAPSATAAQPLRLSFAVDVADLPTGEYVGDITVFRDGVVVPACPGAAVARPDPCVTATALANGVLTESVLSSHASSWDLEAAQVGRLAGADRFATAVAASQAAFPAGNASAVVLARGDDYPDVLVGGPLCAAKSAPLLLTSGATLPQSTEAEIQRVLPAGGTVYVLGGTKAVPASVAGELTTLGYHVTRYGGIDRYATATQVADALGDPTTVLLATGTNFPDALSAGVAAAEDSAAVLLTNGASLPSATTDYLKERVATVYAVGGPAAAADPSATPIVGEDRYETAVDVAQQFFPAPASLGFASGLTFPDALSGTALLARTRAPLLLTVPTGLPATVATYVGSVQNTVATAQLLGGDAAITDSVWTDIKQQLGN